MIPLPFSHPGHVVCLLLLPCIYALYKTARVRVSRLGMGCRLLSLGLLIAGLSGVQLPGKPPGASVVFVLDHSDSVSQADRTAALAYINRVARAMTPHDRAGLVVFGKDAFIEQAFTTSLALSTVHSTPGGVGTDMALALRLAVSMLEPYASRRIVLLSDGNQTAGDAVREARIAAARGITIDVVGLGASASPRGPDVRIEAMRAPSPVRMGEPFDVVVSLQSDVNTRASLKLYHNGAQVAEQRTTLTGSSRKVVRVPQRLDTSGFHQYIGVLESPEDTWVANNESGTVVYAVGQPRVLYVTETPAPQGLIDILTRRGFAVDRVDPSAMPSSPQALSPYEVVIVDNVPAASLGEAHMQATADYVQQFGGGLIMIGGTQSFGPGGYARTPLEQILPVDMHVSRRDMRSSLGLVLLLDKSGSMATREGEKGKIDVARDVVVSLQKLLSPEDSLGIIAFDTRASVLLPLARIGNRVLLHEPVHSLQASGGTDLYPALDMAYQWLQHAPMKKKHMLLISDGRTVPRDFAALLSKLNDAHIALSVVGIGPDANRGFLSELATRGKGRAYFAQDRAGLSEIVQRETLQMAGQWVQQRQVKLRATATHEVFKGIEVASMPALGGYVASTAKPLATVLLASDRQDPILALWRFGLGKALVFTSDLSSSWTSAFTAWEAFATLWTHMVRWSSRGVQSHRLHPRVSVQGDTPTLTVDAFAADGRFLNFLEMRAAIHTPQAQDLEMRLEQTASGTYTAQFAAEQPGTYLFSITSSGKPEQPEDALYFGVHLATLPEHRTRRPNLALLREIAGMTSGSVLSLEAEASLLRPEPSIVSIDAWHLAALAALFLFVIEVALRRGFSLKQLLFSRLR